MRSDKVDNERVRHQALLSFVEEVMTTGSVPVIDGTVNMDTDDDTINVSEFVSERSAASPAGEDCLHDVTVLARKLKA